MKTKLWEKYTDNLTLVEFLIKEEGEKNTAETREWAGNFLVEAMRTGRHFGDCNKQPQPCSLCILKNILEDYEDYCTEKKMIRYWKREIPKDFKL